MPKQVLLVLLLMVGSVRTSRAQASTDSLERRLETATGGDRVGTLAGLTEAYQRSDPQKAIAFGREALVLLKRDPDDEALGRVLHQTGRAYVWVSRFDSAIAFGERLEDLSRKLDNQAGIGDALNLKGTARSMQGSLVEAKELFESALRMREDIQDSVGVANSLSNLGIVEMRLGNFDASLDYYMRSLSVWESLGDRSGIARVLTNVGNVHFDYGNLEEAIDFYERVLRMREEEGDRRGIAILRNNIGLVHAEREDFERAVESYEIALDIWEKAGDRTNTARALSNLGNAYASMGRLDEALQFSRRALAIREEVGDRRGAAITLSGIGRIESTLARPEAARSTLLRALKIAEEVGDQNLLRDIHLNLSEAYEASGDYRAALDEYRVFKALQDSLFNAESQSTIAELQTQYRTKEQQQQIALLESERELQVLWRNILLAGLLVLVVVASLIYSRYRLKNRAHRALEKAHADLKTAQTQLVHAEKLASLGQLTAGIAHHIKNPLNFVNNFADVSRDIAGELREKLAATGADSDPEVRELIADLSANMSTIAQQGRRADDIVRGMMEHASGIKGRREPTDLNALVADYVDLSYEGMKARHADFFCEIHQDYDPTVGVVNLVPQEIGRVVVNLVYNAFEAMRDHAVSIQGEAAAELHVTTRRVADTAQIRIRDNGPGIPDDVRDKIFEPFFTTKPGGTGTGLGLSLSYDIVTSGHGGELTVESPPGDGAEFVVTLPVDTSVVRRP